MDKVLSLKFWIPTLKSLWQSVIIPQVNKWFETKLTGETNDSSIEETKEKDADI